MNINKVNNNKINYLFPKTKREILIQCYTIVDDALSVLEFSWRGHQKRDEPLHSIRPINVKNNFTLELIQEISISYGIKSILSYKFFEDALNSGSYQVFFFFM